MSLPAHAWGQTVYNLVMTKQFAGVMPQAIAAWCRRDGHRIAYRTYYGVGDPGHCIPHDVDILFIASYTQASPLA